MTDKPLFKLRLHASVLIGVGLSWAYLVHPFLLPLGLPVSLHIVLASAALVGVCVVYRSLHFDVEIRPVDLVVLGSYLVLFGLLNQTALGQALASDELYHAERGSSFHFLPPSWRTCPSLIHIPIHDLNHYVSLVFLGGAAGLIWGVKKLFSLKNKRVAYGGLFVLFVVVGAVSTRFPIEAEPHPPLRLLPLFVSQLFLGLSDLTFRLPSLVAATLVSWWVFRATQPARSSSFVFPYGMGVAVFMIPTVFHTSAITQPSIWAYVSGAFCFFAVRHALQHKDEKGMVWAGVIIGLGCLFRQNTLLFWPVLGLIFLAEKKFWPHAVRIFLPGLFLIPYLSTVFHLGHPAARVVLFKNKTVATSVSPSPAPTPAPPPPSVVPTTTPQPEQKRLKGPLGNVVRSISSGRGPGSVWRNTGPVWLLFLIIGFLFVVRRTRGSLLLYYLTFFSGYGLFFSIGPGLWGMGRYHVEFVAPVMLATWVLLAPALAKNKALWAGLVFVLSGASWMWNQIAPQDIQHDWPEKKLTTEFYVPYDEAFGWLKRQGSQGRFVVLGGLSLYGTFELWMRGFTYQEALDFQARQEKMEAFIKEGRDPDTFVSFLKDHQIDTVVIQYGDKKADRQRSPSLNQLLSYLTSSQQTLKRQITFHEPWGSSIDIYTLRNPFYPWVD